MNKNLWLNLPVKNLAKSTKFFLEIGFNLNSEYGNSENCTSLIIGDNKVVLMLFEEHQFKGASQNEIAYTKKGTEVIFSIGAETEEEVDKMAEKVAKAGGTVFAKPAPIEGWMYNCGFADIDGHRWNMLYMDISKMPKNTK